jgi:hypothetical protein
MTTKKPRRPVQSSDLADLQTIMDQAAQRDAAENTPTTPSKTETENVR